jgi:uncharacterized ion transporter superfamily protein YfcC
MGRGYYLMKEFNMFLVIIGTLIIVAVVQKKLYGYVIRPNESARSDEERQREIRNLEIARKYYIVTWYGACAVAACFLLALHSVKDSGTERMVLSFLVYYGGFFGLIAKMGGLKLPISQTSKIYHVINIALIILSTIFFFHKI